MTALDFRLLARSADAGTFAVTVPPGCVYFEGHFPGAPILPAIAQLVALVQDRVHALWPELGQPRRVARLKFARAIAPGDEVEVQLVRADTDVRFTLVCRGDTCTRGVLGFAPAP